MRSSRTNAFTLVELLVVVSIIAVLMAVLLPALKQAQEEGRVVTCQANLRSIAQTMFMYANDSQGILPYQAVGYADWSGTLAPYGNARMFRCPDDRVVRLVVLSNLPIRSYAVNSGKFQDYVVNLAGYHCPWPVNPQDKPEKLADIPSYVVLVSENFGRDAAGNGWNNDSQGVVGLAAYEGLDAHAWALHRDTGANYNYSDGHVDFRLKSDMDKWRADTDYGGVFGDPWKWK